jgi:hypothetical protein
MNPCQATDLVISIARAICMVVLVCAISYVIYKGTKEMP